MRRTRQPASESRDDHDGESVHNGDGYRGIGHGGFSAKSLGSRVKPLSL